MKKLKTKNNQKRTPRSTKKIKVILVHAKTPVLRHLRLVPHTHTGNVLHIRHTSYLALFAILVFVGFFLMISQNIANANTLSVGLIVNGPAPTVGATIVSPFEGTSYENIGTVAVIGTCAPTTFVAVRNNGTLLGSSICSAAGEFEITIQLSQGTNALAALNYDNLNQPGPATQPVTVTYTPSVPVVEASAPATPENPLVIPGVITDVTNDQGLPPDDCEDYGQIPKLVTGGTPRVVVVCVPRTIESNKDQAIGILVWGGQPPYALNFKWGDDATTLISMDAPGYKTINVRYASSGIYNINIQLTDKNASQAVGQSAIEVVGQKTPGQALSQTIDDLFGTSWFETPVPLYLTALGVTLGFWSGDIFNRRFGAERIKTRRPIKHSA